MTTKTQTIHLLDCPACGKPIEMHATYDVRRLDQSTNTGATEMIVTAKVTMTGARVNHECPPKPLSFFTEGGNPLARGGVVTTHNPVIRED